MAKTLNQFIESYLKVKSADEQKFVDKHVTAKVADRNGNGDDVFKGNTKTIDRRKDRKGYNPGEDEKVYEALTGKQHKIDANKNGKVDAHDFKLLRGKKKVAEEAEELEELSKDTVRNYFNKGGEQGKKIADKMKMVGGDFSSDGSDTKTLRKRAAGRAMAYKRRTGEIKMSEDSEQIDELSKKTLGSYVVKSLAPGSEKSVSNLASKGGYKLGQAHDDDYTAGEKEDAKSVKRSLGVLTAVRKMTKESRVLAIASKLTTQYGNVPLNKEERLQDRLSDISESHQRVMLEVFEKLSEDNQSKFMTACATPEGVEQMLDFAITYRGE